MGLDAALVLPFDHALSLVSAEEFIERILVGGLRAGAILVGANFRFGHRGAGDVRLLGEFGKRYGFDVEIIPPVEVAGKIVSSTAIRGAVASGDVAGAIPMLGRPFSLTGEIRAGAGRGRTILFPTLNLAPEQELLPKLGVYATESRGGRDAVFLGDECRDAAYVRRVGSHRRKPFVRIQRNSGGRTDGSAVS